MALAIVISNYVLAAAIIAAIVDFQRHATKVHNRLTDIEDKLDLVLGFEVDDDDEEDDDAHSR